METQDWQSRVHELEKAVENAESRAQQSSARAAAMRDQLELAQLDKRSLVAQNERVSSNERKLRLELAESMAACDKERSKLHDLESRLMTSQADSRVARLRIEMLETTLSSAEAEAKWYGSELDRRSTHARTQARESASKQAQLQTVLDQAQGEQEALKRQIVALQKSYSTSQEQLEQAHYKLRSMQQQMDSTEADFTMTSMNGTLGGSSRYERGLEALEAQLEVSQAQETTMLNRISELCKAYEEACDRVTSQAAKVEELEAKDLETSKQLTQLKEEKRQADSSASRLARQVQHLLINATLANDSQPLLTSEEKQELAKALQVPSRDSDTMEVLTERLGYFVDIAELVTQNEQQLRLLDRLSAKCEQYEAQESEESEAVVEAKQTIERLSELVRDLKKERDVLRKEQNERPAPAPTTAPITSTANGSADVLKNELELAKSTSHNLQIQLSDAQKAAANATERVNVLTQDVANTRDIAEQLRFEKARLTSQCRLAEEQFNNQQNEITELLRQRNELRADLGQLREQLNEKDRNLNSTQTALLSQIESLQSELTSAKHELGSATTQLKMHSSQMDLARKTTDELRTELLQKKLAHENLQMQFKHLEQELQDSAERLKLRTLSFTTADSDKAHQLEDQLAQAGAQIQDLRTLASDTQKALDATQAERTAEKTQLETQITETKALLEKTQTELETLRNTPPDTTELDNVKKALDETKELLDKTRAVAEGAAQANLTEQQAAEQRHRAAVTELESKFTAAQAQVGELQAQVQSLHQSSSGEKERLETQVSSLTKQHETLNTLVDELRVENAELKSNNELLLEQLQASVKVEGDEMDVEMDTTLTDETNRLVTMLKRDKQAAVTNLQVAESKIRNFELQVGSLQRNVERLETELAKAEDKSSVQSSEIAAELEKSNSELVEQLKTHTSDLESLRTELKIAQESLKPLEAELRNTQNTVSSLTQELEVVKSDRDMWKTRVGDTGNTQLVELQEKLSQSENQFERLRQESITKLKAEAGEKKAAQAQVSKLNAQIEELAKGSTNQAEVGDQLKHKDDRITHLENEINRLSDELVDHEQTKNNALIELESYKTNLESLRSQLDKATADFSSQVEAKDKELEVAQEKLKEAENSAAASATLNIDTGDATNDTGEDPEELKTLTTKLAGEGASDDVNAFKELVEKLTKDRIKKKTQEFLQAKMKALSEQKDELDKQVTNLQKELATAKENISSMEESAQRKFDLKNKILKSKAENLQKTNEELKLTIRKLKGGESVTVTTLPDGTTKVLQPSQQQQPYQPPQQHQQSHGGHRSHRPTVQRNGTKRMREN